LKRWRKTVDAKKEQDDDGNESQKRHPHPGFAEALKGFLSIIGFPVLWRIPGLLC
jgi:hypothetical protein